MSNLLGVSQFYDKKIKTLDFDGEWFDFIGKPDIGGSWFIWGESGNGKTVFAAKLAKYLSRFGRVIYNSLEEGYSDSLKGAFRNAGITRKHKISIGDKVKMNVLKEKLRKDKSPNFIVIDSFQFSGLNSKTYQSLIEEFPKKTFIFISHAESGRPLGRSAVAANYGSGVKIWVEGYKAFSKSRYKQGEPFIIWAEGAEKYWINK